MLHGPQQGMFDLEFDIPAGCADRLASGAADIGIVPSFELLKQDLEIVPGAGIACRGAVRSILLVSSRRPEEIRTLAADSSSRTSVELARMVLDLKYGARPAVVRQAPDIEAMLRTADAGLIIGDPALRIEPALLPYHSLDLGAEWMDITGLPMVFAVWAARRGVKVEGIEPAFRESCRYGRERIEEIVAAEAPRREIAPGLARDYLQHKIVHELGPVEYEGLERFLAYGKAALAPASSAR
jgi:predicted solute-binding protein